MNTKNLANAMPLPEHAIYMSDLFRDEILINMNYLRGGNGSGSITVTQQEADKYRGDFHGLLLSKGQQRHHLWLLTVFNGLTCSTEYNSDFLVVRIPDTDRLQKIENTFNTVYI